MKDVLLVLVGGAVGLFASYLGQLWTEKRERRNRRDDLRLSLYLDVIAFVHDNEAEVSRITAEFWRGDQTGTPREERSLTPSVEMQSKRKGIIDRLTLLGSKAVQEAFKEYDAQVYFEGVDPPRLRMLQTEALAETPKTLIAIMANDVQAI
jgi:hypothetical protein